MENGRVLFVWDKYGTMYSESLNEQTSSCLMMAEYSAKNLCIWTNTHILL